MIITVLTAIGYIHSLCKFKFEIGRHRVSLVLHHYLKALSSPLSDECKISFITPLIRLVSYDFANALVSVLNRTFFVECFSDCLSRADILGTDLRSNKFLRLNDVWS